MTKTKELCIIIATALPLFAPATAHGQKRFVSNMFHLDINSETPAMVRPPILDVQSMSFHDTNGNNAIDAQEECRVEMVLRNSGFGDAKGLKAVLTASGAAKDIQCGSFDIPDIGVGETATIAVPVIAGMDIMDGIVDLAVKIDEPDGFGTDDQIISVSTRSFKAPSIRLVDWSVTADKGMQVSKMQQFTLTLLIQNTETGDAEDVEMDVTLPDNVFNLSGGQHVSIGHLDGGEAKIYEYALIANNNYNAANIPVSVRLSERFGKYAENGTADIKMNQRLSSSKITIAPVADKRGGVVEIASLTSDVDRDIPETGAVNDNRFALIFGNEDYHSSQPTLASESDVVYARHDAEVFYSYCVNTMGIKPDNIILRKDATAATMRQDISKTVKLSKMNRDKTGEAEIVFYYAGHGFPDEKTKEPYIVPVDVSAANLQSGIRLADLYRDLASSEATKISVFLDACFSGGGRQAGLLDARGVRIVPKEGGLTGNMVIFSATSSDQVALPYSEEKHGMFTYFLLKKLQESGGRCSYGDLSDYVRSHVAEYALRVNDKEQVPQTTFSVNVADDWINWMVK